MTGALIGSTPARWPGATARKTPMSNRQSTTASPRPDVGSSPDVLDAIARALATALIAEFRIRNSASRSGCACSEAEGMDDVRK